MRRSPSPISISYQQPAFEAASSCCEHRSSGPRWDDPSWRIAGYGLCASELQVQAAGFKHAAPGAEKLMPPSPFAVLHHRRVRPIAEEDSPADVT